MKKIPFTKKNIRHMFVRIIDDCDQCLNAEHLKGNIMQEAEWFGFKIKKTKQHKGDA